MKASVFFAALTLLPGLNLFAQDSDIGFAPSSPLITTSIAVGAGTRSGDLVWSIAGNSSGPAIPNILSELTYNDVDFKEYTARLNLTINADGYRKTYIEASLKQGKSDGGSVTDSDYRGNNRTIEYSRSLSNAKDSESLEFKAAIGYLFTPYQHITLIPLLGYIYSEQDMRMQNGVQVVDTSFPITLGPFRSILDSHYKAEWHGGWVGLNTAFHAKKHRVDIRTEYQRTDYQAEADWNLRSDFKHPKSFAHWADGEGFTLSARYQFSFDNIALWLQYDIEDWKTDPGKDVVYGADGSSGETRLNEVSWEASGYYAGFNVTF